jgi:TonB family protein
MKTKKGSGKNATIRLLMILPVIAGLTLFITACSQNNKSAEAGTELAPPPPPPPPPPVAETDTGSIPYVQVDEMPVFKGGDPEILKYIAQNTIYPELAKKNGIQGKVIVRFAVEIDGSIDKISVLQGVDTELDREAMRVVGTLPAFEKPGIKDGKVVSVWYMIPINFTLR